MVAKKLKKPKKVGKTKFTYTSLKKLRSEAEYYIQFDYPGSWYDRNPYDAKISIYYKDLLVLLDEIDRLRNKNNG